MNAIDLNALDHSDHSDHSDGSATSQRSSRGAHSELRISPNTALIVIDVQQTFDDHGYWGSGITRMPKTISSDSLVTGRIEDFLWSW